MVTFYSDNQLHPSLMLDRIEDNQTKVSVSLRPLSVKARLHYGVNRSKLVHFKEHKNIFLHS
jgi:hypothetical protein